MQEPFATHILEAALGLGLDHIVDHAGAERLAAYMRILMTWNKRMNLVGPGGWRRAFDELVADSLHLAAWFDDLALAPELCLDLGAGAGLPGIPLRSVWGRGRHLLVEVRAKRAAFMRAALRELKPLGLEGVEVFEARAEDALERWGAHGADLVLSRAFMPPEKYLALVRGHLGPGGRCLVMASQPPAAAEAHPGWRVVQTHAYAGPGSAPGRERWFWLLAPTPTVP